MLTVGEIVFSGKSTPIGYPIPNTEPQNIQTSNIMPKEQVIFRNIYVYMLVVVVLL